MLVAARALPEVIHQMAILTSMISFQQKTLCIGRLTLIKY
jgi:hypothetical protein